MVWQTGIHIFVAAVIVHGSHHFEAAFQGRCGGTVPCAQTCSDLSNGAYECGCREGFILLPNGYDCQDKSEYEADALRSPEAGISLGLEGRNETLVEYSVAEKQFNQSSQPARCSLECRSGICVREGTSYETVERCQCPFGLKGDTCTLPAMLSSSVRFRNPEVRSGSYVSFPPLVGAYKNLRITLELRAESWDGVILLTGEKEDMEGDYVALVLKGGFLEFRFDCGSGEGLLRSGEPIKLHEWTRVRIDRHGRDARLWVQHSGVTRARAQGVFSRITFRQPVYLGGIGNMTSAESKLSTRRGFHGCVRNFEVNDYKYDLGLDSTGGWDLEPCTTDLCVHAPCMHGGQCVESAQSRDVATCLCPLGYSGELCETQVNLQVPSFNGSSYLKYSPLGQRGRLYFEIKVIIKPKQGNALVWYTGNTYLRDFAALRLKDGYAEFLMDLGEGLVSVRSGIQLELDEWHEVRVIRTGKEAILRVKGQADVEGYSPGPFVQMTLTDQIFVGGLPSDVLPSVVLGHVQGYSGCIQQFSINGDEIPMVAAALSGVNVENCNHPCASGPCGDRGQCRPDEDEFLCDCKFGWGGSQCQYKLDEGALEVPMFVGRSYLHYTSKDIAERIRGTQLSINLRFRTGSPDGLILWSGRKQSGSLSDFFSLTVEKSRVHFRYSLGKGEADITCEATAVSDGRWHHIQILRTDQQAWLIVDEGQTYSGYSEGRLKRMDVNTGLYLGGAEDVYQISSGRTSAGFRGCVSDLTLSNDFRVNLTSQASTGVNIERCE